MYRIRFGGKEGNAHRLPLFVELALIIQPGERYLQRIFDQNPFRRLDNRLFLRSDEPDSQTGKILLQLAVACQSDRITNRFKTER